MEFALQAEQLGTGHAVEQAKAELAGHEGPAFVIYGDTPFLGGETLARMEAGLESADIIVLGFEADDPARYGRLITRGDVLERIVEWKDATAEERAVTLCNSGVIAARAPLLFELLGGVTNENAAGEYYLTKTAAAPRPLRRAW